MKDLNLKFNSFHFSECEVSQCPVEWSGSSYLYWVWRGIVLVQDLTDWLTSQRSNQLVVSAAAHPPIPTLPARMRPHCLHALDQMEIESSLFPLKCKSTL